MKFSTILMGVGLAMTVAGTANAGKFTADCDGWSEEGVWEVPHPANVNATATLEQYDAASGTWLTIESSVDAAYVPAYAPFLFGGTWTGPLAGTYRASIVFAAELIYSEVSKETWTYYADFGPFECAPPPPPPSGNPARTPGYWKNHPESWPVTSLTLGDTSYSQACLLDVLDLSTRGDVRIKLIHHLIAAKLNVLPNSIPGIGGTDPSIQPTIDAGDQFLIDSGTTIDCGTLRLTGSAPRGADRDLANGIKDALDSYNNNYDIDTSGAGLTAAEGEGGCTAMSAESHFEALALPLLALFFVRRASRRRRT